MSTSRPRLFTLQRDTDVTGVSGTGTVVYGGATRIVWDDRTPEEN
ncbi:hypothetical protein AB0B79_18220 [Streptomyces sp. NPDC039022]